uniref:U94-Liphistoxin-Lsp1b_1 n=1 Tax=Liphistius sp. SGP-2016 TaxID=1905180 RepID=A0A4Q8K496_9ARAC
MNRASLLFLTALVFFVDSAEVAFKLPATTLEEEILKSIHNSQMDIKKTASVQEADEKVTMASACYQDIGCFYRNGTFKHLKVLPDSPQYISTSFALYTRKNKNSAVYIHYLTPSSFEEPLIDSSKPLKVLCHGFVMSGTDSYIMNMKNALLDHEDCNVLVVDWSRGALPPFYISAAIDTELVGRQVARVIQLLKERRGFPESNVHVIGFSLGSHLAGFAGKWMKSHMGLTLGRITALDPASPLFEGYGESVHVSRRDAALVDVIHTSAGTSVLSGELGMTEAVGHMDFYPNGGKKQPGCSGLICYHMRALDLFTSSIGDRCEFRSISCENYDIFDDGGCFQPTQVWGRMGYYANLASGRGIMYLATTGDVPFCGVSVLLTMKVSEGQSHTYCGISATLVGADGVTEYINITDSNSQKVHPGEVLQKLAVVHPNVLPLHEVYVQYRKYRGWFYSGTDSINFDNLRVKDHESNIQFLYETKNTNLASYEEKMLTPKNFAGGKK